MPPEIEILLTWLAVVGAMCIIALVLAVLLGRTVGEVIEDFLRWVR